MTLVTIDNASAEFYKCNHDGKTIYSDKPCGINNHEIIIQKDVYQKTSNSRKKLSADISQDLENSRKKRDFTRKINSLRTDIDLKIESRDFELAKLKRKKNRAKNNLAGAEWESSISEEMIAVTNKYNTEIISINKEITSLENDIKSLEK